MLRMTFWQGHVKHCDVLKPDPSFVSDHPELLPSSCLPYTSDSGFSCSGKSRYSPTCKHWNTYSNWRSTHAASKRPCALREGCRTSQRIFFLYLRIETCFLSSSFLRLSLVNFLSGIQIFLKKLFSVRPNYNTTSLENKVCDSLENRPEVWFSYVELGSHVSKGNQVTC